MGVGSVDSEHIEVLAVMRSWSGGSSRLSNVTFGTGRRDWLVQP